VPNHSTNPYQNWKISNLTNTYALTGVFDNTTICEMLKKNNLIQETYINSKSKKITYIIINNTILIKNKKNIKLIILYVFYSVINTEQYNYNGV